MDNPKIFRLGSAPTKPRSTQKVFQCRNKCGNTYLGQYRNGLCEGCRTPIVERYSKPQRKSPAKNEYVCKCGNFYKAVHESKIGCDKCKAERIRQRNIASCAKRNYSLGKTCPKCGVPVSNYADTCYRHRPCSLLEKDKNGMLINNFNKDSN